MLRASCCGLNLVASFWRLPVRVVADPAGEPLVPRRVRWHGDLFVEDFPPSAAGVGLPLALCE